MTGGGTSGHISPALAIIDAIQKQAQQDGNWTPQFLYVGGKTGLEKELVEATGIAFHGVETGKLRRYFSAQNFTDMARVPVGVAQSRRAVKGFAPHVVLATGGYVAVPPVIAAGMLHLPVVIHEQTVQIGLANKIAARFATKIGLASELALEELSPKLRAKCVVVGNPLRPAIFGGDAKSGTAFAGFAPQDKRLPTIYITGGSQGARVLNRAALRVLAEMLRGARVIHQCGKQPPGDEQDFDVLGRGRAALPEELQRRYFVTPFIGAEINHVFALADLVISRAGAGTVGELCALGKPAIYVPLVPTRGDEQTRNARVCELAGAAQILPQKELENDALWRTAQPLLRDRAQLERMSAAAKTLSKPNAAQEMARLVIELAQSRAA